MPETIVNWNPWSQRAVNQAGTPAVRLLAAGSLTCATAAFDHPSPLTEPPRPLPRPHRASPGPQGCEDSRKLLGSSTHSPSGRGCTHQSSMPLWPQSSLCLAPQTWQWVHLPASRSSAP